MAARASIKSHSMSLLTNIITKTALSVGGLVLFHPWREPATRGRASPRHLKQGQRKRGGGEVEEGTASETMASFNAIVRRRCFD